MFVLKWYWLVIGLTIIAAAITIPVVWYFTVPGGDACSSEDTSTCEAAKGNCEIIESTWKCDCNKGYMNAAGDTQTCEDIDECKYLLSKSCEADKGNCVNLESTWRCDCNDGYKNVSGNTETCVDIDECIEGDTASCEAGKGSCVNMDSTWRCDCNIGYINADKYTCVDIDECIDGDTSSCVTGTGHCVNLVSTWYCDCNEGFKNPGGNIQSCEPNACGDETKFTTRQGELDFPAGNHQIYPPDVDCAWTLSTTPDKIFLLQFTRFLLGSILSCLDVQHVLSSGSRSVDELCGFFLPGDHGLYYVYHHNIRLVFQSNEYIQSEEFQLQWTTVDNNCATESTLSCEAGTGDCITFESTWMCNCLPGYENPVDDTKKCVAIECGIKTQSSVGEGTLAYPGDGGEYEIGKDCIWVLTAPPGNVLTLNFLELDIEYYQNCAFDYLEIYDDSMTESSLIKRLCGSTLPEDGGAFNTMSNKLRLVFHSDLFNTGTGFKLTWTSVVNYCLLEDTSSCDEYKGYCFTLDHTWKCKCHPGYNNPGTDVKTCED